MQQRLGLLRRMQLQAELVAQPLGPGTQRNEGFAAHLDVVVQRLHRGVVEPVARIALARRPDQCLVGIGEAPAAEVRHRVGLAPDHVVQHPEAQVLQRGTDAEDVVVGADHPQRAVLAQQPAAFREPFAGERVIGGKIGEAVPVLVHPIDQAVVRPPQFATKLQVVGRIGEHAMHRGRRQHAHQLHAVPQQNLVQRQFADHFHVSSRREEEFYGFPSFYRDGCAEVTSIRRKVPHGLHRGLHRGPRRKNRVALGAERINPPPGWTLWLSVLLPR